MSIEADFTTVTNSLDRHDRPAHEALRRIRAALKGGELDKDAAVDDATHAAAEALEKHGIKVDLDALNDQISQAIKD